MPTDYQWTTLLLLFVLAGMATYVLRLSVIVFVGYGSGIPDSVANTLGFVPPAVLSALAIASLVRFSPTAPPVVHYDPVELVAGGVAVIVAWRTRNVLLTIAVGMLVLWSAKWLVS